MANDSVGSSNLKEFKKRFPERLVNVGIAEQNMVGVSAGLANGGLIPFVCGASCFLTGRALEQVKVDLGYSRSNVKLCGMSSGVAYGELGPTHHSIEDLAWTRAIANMTVIVPADPAETAAAVRAAAAYDGPVFLRLSRMPVPDVHPADYGFDIGRAARLRAGSGRHPDRQRHHGLPRAGGSRASGSAMASARRWSTCPRSARSTGKRLWRQRPRDPSSPSKSTPSSADSGAPWRKWWCESHPVRMRLLGFPGVFAPTGFAVIPVRTFRSHPGAHPQRRGAVGGGERPMSRAKLILAD